MMRSTSRDRRFRLATATAITCGGALAVLLVGAALAGPPDEKAQIDDRHRQEGAVSPRPKGDQAQERPTTRVTNPPAPTGIINTDVSPFPSSQFLVTNRWQAIIGDALVAVIAGGAPNSSTGRLAVLRLTSDGASVTDVRWVDLPDRSGRPRITAAQDHTLAIETTGGLKFSFNADTLQLTPQP
jgi:hypothetical protein